MGEVEAVDEAAAIGKTAEKLKMPTTKLIAARRRWSCPHKRRKLLNEQFSPNPLQRADPPSLLVISTQSTAL